MLAAVYGIFSLPTLIFSLPTLDLIAWAGKDPPAIT